jgi:hypothetical protein
MRKVLFALFDLYRYELLLKPDPTVHIKMARAIELMTFAPGFR